ncbi:hypothetical protein ACREYJ_15735 [Pseudomonas kribbensis]|uniref:hypothetical protein n=1 Tax=Pseudomonas kribbensis TaxID=1628086 RepID=UPI003D76BCFF
MTDRYAVVLQSSAELPERTLLVNQAWGSVPVSFVQDEEDFNDCSFLDLKINKWEVNIEWSGKQAVEPWIRIEKIKEEMLDEFLKKESRSWPLDVAGKTLMTIQLDEGGSALDDVLLLRLVSVFLDRFKVYRCSDSVEEVSREFMSYIPAQHTVLERLIKCEQD